MKKFLVLMLLVCGTAYAGEKTMTEYYKPGCPHCKNMEPVIRSFEQGAGVTVEVITDGEKARAKGIQNAPTFIIEKDGKMIGKRVGELPLKGMEAFWNRPTIQEPKRPAPPGKPIAWAGIITNIFLALIVLRVWTKK